MPSQFRGGRAQSKILQVRYSAAFLFLSAIVIRVSVPLPQKESMSFRYGALLLLLCAAAEASEIKGKVTNAMGGEPLGRVQVTVLEVKVDAVTSAEGGFDIHDLAAGRYTLRINAVGYRLITIPITLASADDTKELSITLVPDNFHHTDRVEVHGDVFQTSDSPATNETTLTSSEIREASTVFADDPFRAVQALPGVSAAGNNEFFAEFSVMGAPFSSVSIYIDDVLVHSPFHEIGNFSEGASLGVLTSEVVEEMKLMPAAYPEKFGDAIGAALDIHTRERSRAEPTVRISGGVAASDLLAEGGFGVSKKGSWLISGRKSYINYLVRNRVQNAPDIGFEDADLKLNYDLTPRQNVSLFATDGHTNLAMNNTASLGQFDYASGKSDFTFSRAGWRWTVTPRLLLDARAAYYREPDQLFNNQNILLTKTDHREWVGGTGVSWAWANDQVLQAGWSERFLRDSESQAAATLSGALRLFAFSGNGLRQSGYVQEASSLLGGRVHVLGSLRWDRFQSYLPQRFSPEASVAVHAARGTEFQLSAGRYSQFSNSAFAAPPGLCVADGSLPPRSDHYAAAIEERLSENTRIRVEAFQRKDFYVLGAIRSLGHGSSCPGLEPIPGGTYQRDYSQGVQVVLQRRSANRLSG